MTLTLIGYPQSRAMRVMWMLEELELDYDLVPARPHAPEICAVNPSGKVPALRVDDVVLTDSVAICQFLADREGKLTAPAGTIARATQDGHTQFICDEVDGALWIAAKHSFALPEELRIKGVKDTARFEFIRAMERVETRLGQGPYLAGDAFAVPDVILAHCLSWAKSAKFETGSEIVDAYGKRCRARPAFRRALERAAAY
ncbi:glutathione S-transferase family protein [Pontivivens nitratireducens]|uniref:Glutathione S-transferase family protein n=1 Tax=Pontivivens nitratireducens TaxID=2758038 RepID=A0A6G7VHF4_9RHOB|nr:glutathione S-transferase family protein [Pontibrevibacter nitratireducens]QIK39451.1 glutathione S-transferase family protein [Pontibrevibacter nitratireducens]